MTLNRNEHRDTMNKRSVICLHPHIRMCLEHTWSVAGLASRRQTGGNWGVKLLEKISLVVTTLKVLQARSNMPKGPNFSETQFIWLMTNRLARCASCCLQIKVSCRKKWDEGNQLPIPCQNRCLLNPYTVQLLFSRSPDVSGENKAYCLSYIQRHNSMNKMNA